MAASILIVDDDAVQRRLVENMVQKCGYEPLVVDSGDAAIAALTAPDAQPVDAVVLDLVMPGLDGMGVLAKIREAGLNIPVNPTTQWWYNVTLLFLRLVSLPVLFKTTF